MNLPLKGIIPPMITPLTEAGTLDIDGLNKLVEYLISGGVHGIFLLGTNGEAASLTYEFCKEIKDSPDFSILASTESFLPET
jgi:4-hydroxy-tetrahydrodipicolinate synthase